MSANMLQVLEGTKMQNPRDPEMPDYEMLGASIVHDFNNLLTPIVNVMSELQRDGLGTLRQRERIAGAILCTLRARALAYQLLDLSNFCRIEAEVTNLNALLAPLEAIYSSILGNRVEVILDIPDSLPLVSLDPSLMERAMLNLVLNARNVMYDGGRLAISASLDRMSDSDTGSEMVHVTVSDTGKCIDIPPMFEGNGSSSTRARGNGLGLAMVRRFVAGCGGRVTIASDPGIGTTVSLWIPPLLQQDEEAF